MPEHIVATARFHNGVDMGLSTILTFKDGLQATFDCAFDTCFRNWLEVAGTTHSLVCDDFVQPVSDDKTRFWIHDEKGKSEEFRVPGKNQIVYLIEDFCALAASGKPDYSWGEHSLKTQQLCDLILKSATTGQAIKL
jgi:predicted dehydrogenase